MEKKKIKSIPEDAINGRPDKHGARPQAPRLQPEIKDFGSHPKRKVKKTKGSRIR